MGTTRAPEDYLFAHQVLEIFGTTTDELAPLILIDAFPRPQYLLLNDNQVAPLVVFDCAELLTWLRNRRNGQP